MRIMMVDPLLYPIAYDKALVAALVEAGHEVLFCGRKLTKGETWDSSHGTYLELPLSPPAPPSTTSATRRRAYWLHYHIGYLKALLVAARRNKIFRADVIHIQWLVAPFFDSIFLTLNSKKTATVLTMHDTQVANGDKVSRYQSFGLARALRQFDRIIVHTEIGASRLARRGIEPGIVTHIPHGLLTANSKKSTAMTPRDDKITFLLFGALRPYKGIDILIRAVGLMEPSVRDRCRFVVAGNAGMDVEELVCLANECQVTQFFEFRVGFIPEDELASVLTLADVFVYPYREIEASGSLMLCLQYGKPIVASNIGIFSEILTSGVHGRMTKPGNVEELSRALQSLAVDDHFRIQAALNVKRLSDSIPTWAEIANRTISEYHKVCSPY